MAISAKSASSPSPETTRENTCTYSTGDKQNKFNIKRGLEKMRYLNTRMKERIGYDFYCDIAINIVKARNKKGWTQEELAKESGIKLSAISAMETVKVKIKLFHLEKLSKALDVTINWLIDAEIDSQIGNCLYLVWTERCEDFKLYQKSTSMRMAFLEWEARMNERGVRVNDPRERVFVEIVGVPVTDTEIRDKFPKLTSDEEPIYPDKD